MRVLIIPELFETAKDWQEVTNILTRVGYSVDFVDYETPKTDDIEDQTNFSEHFLIDKTVIVGSGVGGRIAIQLLARHHHHIVAAVLFRTPSLHHRTIGSRFLGFGAFLLLPIRLFLSFNFKKKISAKIVDFLHRDKKSNLYYKITQSEQDTLLPTIKNQVRLIWTKKKSSVHPSVAMRMQKMLPKCDLVFVSGVKEPLHISDPVLVANYIDDYARNL